MHPVFPPGLQVRHPGPYLVMPIAVTIAVTVAVTVAVDGLYERHLGCLGGRFACCRVRHFVAVTAARLVILPGSYQDGGIVVVGRLAVDHALRAAGGRSAYHADSLQLVHHLGLGHEGGHWAERLASEIGVEAGDDDAKAILGQPLGKLDQAAVEELAFVDCHHSRIRLDEGLNFRGVGHRHGRIERAVMLGHLARGVSQVDLGFENLHVLARDLCSSDAPDKLFGLAGEHTAAYHFDPAAGVVPGVWTQRPLVLHEALHVISHSAPRGCRRRPVTRRSWHL